MDKIKIISSQDLRKEIKALQAIILDKDKQITELKNNKSLSTNEVIDNAIKIMVSNQSSRSQLNNNQSIKK